MKKPSVTGKGFLLLLLIVPYLIQMLGAFSSYVTFYHRDSFQTQVVNAKSEELVTLMLSPSEFKEMAWMEVGKEFEYLGKLYDVASIQRAGEKYLITCENDWFEDLFTNWLKSASKSKSKMMPQIQFVEPIAVFDCAALTEIIVNNFTPDRHYLSFSSELIPPPPRFS